MNSVLRSPVPPRSTKGEDGGRTVDALFVAHHPHVVVVPGEASPSPVERVFTCLCVSDLATLRSDRCLSPSLKR